MALDDSEQHRERFLAGDLLERAHDAIKPEKDEDVRETLLEQLQKDVDEFNGKIAETAKKKEQEIMTV